jgi:topoisomerase-4 subunit B
MSMECILAIDYFSTIFSELIKMDICIFYKHHFSEYETRKKLLWRRTKSSNRKLKPKPEITRFKGLGEISPDEFKILLEKLFGLTQLWWIKHIDRTTVVFLHGKNTPDRQEFIIKNLKVELDVTDAV